MSWSALTAIAGLLAAFVLLVVNRKAVGEYFTEEVGAATRRYRWIMDGVLMLIGFIAGLALGLWLA